MAKKNVKNRSRPAPSIEAPPEPPMPVKPWVQGFWYLAAALAIWSRWILGSNWSSVVVVKQDHVLVETGPYGRVRHPIYSGLLLLFLGNAMLVGDWRGLVAVAIVFASFWRKLRLEEFEDRSVPAVITWINPAGGLWGANGNWDLGRPPIASDDVIIPDMGTAGASVLISAQGGSISVNSLTTHENVRFGSTSTTTVLTLTGNLALNSNATLTLVTSTASVLTTLRFQSSNPADNRSITTTGGG